MIKMIALGDSVFAGWDGRKQIEDYRRIPEVIAKINGWYVNNQAIGGTDYGNGINDFSAITQRLNFAGYSLALVEYGVNNWMCGSTAGEVQQGLTLGINNIRKSNPHIKIFVMCPTLDMRKGTATDMNTPNERGLTQNQLNDVIVQACQALDAEYYDWRKQPIITKDNAFWTLGDGASGVHPTAKTSLEIGKRLAYILNGGI